MYLKVLGPLALAVALFAAGYLKGSDNKDEEWRLKWGERNERDKETIIAHEKKIRDTEHEWQTKLNESNKNGQEQREELENTVRNGAAITDRLRVEYKKLAAQSKRCSNSPVTNGSQSTQSAGDLLADMLSRSEQRETEIARYADELAIAHNVCVVSYNALRAQTTEAVTTK